MDLSSFNLKEDFLDTEITRIQMLQISFFLDDWKKFGVAANLTGAELVAIERDGQNEEDRRYKVLEKWHQHDPNKATYRTLLEFLVSIRRLDIAQEVCKLNETKDKGAEAVYHESRSTIPHPHKLDEQDKQVERLCQKYTLRSADIDKEVTNDHILEIYSQLERWNLVARHLGLTPADVEAIERAERDELQKRYYMLCKWKSKKMLDGTATYHVLLKAVKM